MYLDNDPSQKLTPLQHGDSILWYKNDGTLQLTRRCTRLKKSDGDDKSICQLNSLADFRSVALVVAETHGLGIELIQDTNRVAEFQFV